MKPGVVYFTLSSLSVGALFVSRIDAFTSCSSTPRSIPKTLTFHPNAGGGSVFVPWTGKVGLSMVTEENASSSNNNESSNKRKQRKRRKQPQQSGSDVLDTVAASTTTTTTAAAAAAAATYTPVTIKSDAPVKLQVLDVRDLMAGRSSASSSSATGTPVTTDSPSSSVFAQSSSSDVRTTSRSATASSVGSSSSSSSIRDNSSSGGSTDDALERLLEDARQMQSAESSSSSSSNDDGFSIPKTALSALSTLLTIDFFVVCGFLVWFLAGIFGSYALKDDSIQIAFNNIFPSIVQPALGLLMIGSLASAVFKEEDNSEN